MERQEILYLLLGLALGVILTSILFLRAPAASERARELGIYTDGQHNEEQRGDQKSDEMSMDAMTEALKNKSGDDFDKAFIALMIEHHEGAVSMAELALKQAGHQEIKDLAKAIVEAQNKEIKDMKGWYQGWGFGRMMPAMMDEEMMMHNR